MQAHHSTSDQHNTEQISAPRKPLPAFPSIAVVGATGAVGCEFLEVLSDLDVPMRELRLFASERSAGKTMHFKGASQVPAGDIVIEAASDDAFVGIDIALFSAGASVSKALRAACQKSGTLMIDNSSAFRMEPDVPLVVPEVNPQDAFTHTGVIANPNCSTIQMVVALAPLYKRAGIERIVVSTYQAASGAGAPAMDELYQQTRAYLNHEELHVQAFQHQIAFNCIPHIDVFLPDGSTKEEWKMVQETKKIMGDQSIRVAATCVRVPVLRCHGEAVSVQFKSSLSVEDARTALEAAPNVQLMDDPAHNTYPMPGLLAGTNKTYVGRLRADASVEHGLQMWVVADQIRKGAALNAVQIALLLMGKPITV